MAYTALRRTEVAGPIHLVTGGSIGTEYETITSDMDAFMIGDDEDGAAKIRRTLTECSTRPVDLEHMPRPQFNELIGALRSYRPSLSAGLSPFSFGDLRFLVRVVQGKPLLRDESTESELFSIHHQLREACAFYISSLFIMRYQDAYGLWHAVRINDLVLVAGELIQLASLLALLQTDLVDLAPKSAPARAISSNKVRVAETVSELTGHLRHLGFQEPVKWGARLFALVNATVAGGMISARASLAEVAEKGASLDPKFCVMGVPGYLTAFNVLTNRAVLINEPYLAAAVQAHKC